MMKHLGLNEGYNKQSQVKRSSNPLNKYLECTSLLDEFICSIPNALCCIESAINDYNVNRFMLFSHKNNSYYCLVFCVTANFYKLMCNSFFHQLGLVSPQDIGTINITRDSMTSIIKNASDLSSLLDLHTKSGSRKITDITSTIPLLTVFEKDWKEGVFLLNYMSKLFPQISSIHTVCASLLEAVANESCDSDPIELSAEFYFTEILSFLEKILIMKSQFTDFKLGFVCSVGVIPILLEILGCMKVVIQNDGNGFLCYCPFVPYKIALSVLQFIVTVLSKSEYDFYSLFIEQICCWPSILQLLLFFLSRWAIHKTCIKCEEPIPNPNHKKKISDETHMIFFVVTLIKQITYANKNIIYENFLDIISVLSGSLCNLNLNIFQLATIATSETLCVIVDTLKIVYKKNQDVYYKDVLKYLNKTLTTDFVRVLSQCTLWPSKTNENQFLEDCYIFYRMKIVENSLCLLNLLSFTTLHSREHLHSLLSSNILERMYLIHKNSKIPPILQQVELASGWLIKLDFDCYTKEEKKRFKKIHAYFSTIYKKQKEMDAKNNQILIKNK